MTILTKLKKINLCSAIQINFYDHNDTGEFFCGTSLICLEGAGGGFNTFNCLQLTSYLDLQLAITDWRCRQARWSRDFFIFLIKLKIFSVIVFIFLLQLLFLLLQSFTFTKMFESWYFISNKKISFVRLETKFLFLLLLSSSLLLFL